MIFLSVMDWIRSQNDQWMLIAAMGALVAAGAAASGVVLQLRKLRKPLLILSIGTTPADLEKGVFEAVLTITNLFPIAITLEHMEVIAPQFGVTIFGRDELYFPASDFDPERNSEKLAEFIRREIFPNCSIGPADAVRTGASDGHHTHYPFLLRREASASSTITVSVRCTLSRHDNRKNSVVIDVPASLSEAPIRSLES